MKEFWTKLPKWVYWIAPAIAGFCAWATPGALAIFDRFAQGEIGAQQQEPLVWTDPIGTHRLYGAVAHIKGDQLEIVAQLYSPNLRDRYFSPAEGNSIWFVVKLKSIDPTTPPVLFRTNAFAKGVDKCGNDDVYMTAYINLKPIEVAWFRKNATTLEIVDPSEFAPKPCPTP